jgi:hypothetical protein
MLRLALVAAGLLGPVDSGVASGSWLGRHADGVGIVLTQVPSITPTPNRLKFKGGGSSQIPYMGTLKPPPRGYKFKGGGADQSPYVGVMKPPPGGYKFKDGGSGGGERLCDPSIGRRVFFENCWWQVRRVCVARWRPPRESFTCVSCPDLPGGRCPGAPSRPWDR